jgi:hypothetical protein
LAKRENVISFTVTRILGKPGERENLEYLGVDGWIIIGCIFRKWDVRAWTGSMWIRIGTGGGHL